MHNLFLLLGGKVFNIEYQIICLFQRQERAKQRMSNNSSVIKPQHQAPVTESHFIKPELDVIPTDADVLNKGAELPLNVTAARKAAYPMNWTGPSKSMYQHDQWLGSDQVSQVTGDNEQRSTVFVAEQNSPDHRNERLSAEPGQIVTNSSAEQRSPGSDRVSPRGSHSADVTEVG